MARPPERDRHPIGRRPAGGLTDGQRLAALGGLVGPAGFITAWVVSGALTDGYAAVDDAISRLAAVDAPTRMLMTGGFVVFGVGVLGYASALRHGLAGWSWAAAATSAIATLGVAASPLDRSAALDTAHGVFAGIGYVALAATPLLAIAPLRRAGRSSWARAATGATAVAATCLALTLTGARQGLFQRIGLGAGDLWIMATAVALARDLLRPQPSA